MSDAFDADSGLYATFRLAEREQLSHLTELLCDDSAVGVVGVCDPEGAECDPIMVDLDPITDKQWEALSHAARLGHYSGPRGGNLGVIAEELGISESAVSQRLRAAESTILSQILTAQTFESDSR